MEIPVKNWVNHTNLEEIKILWKVGTTSGEVKSPNLAPGAAGTITLPARSWQDGEILNLKFFRPGGLLVDEFNLWIGKQTRHFPGEAGPAPRVSEDARSLSVHGSDFTVVFDKATGLVAEGTFRDRRILEGGPFLNLGSVPLSPWWVTDIPHSTSSEAAVIKHRLAAVSSAGPSTGDVCAILDADHHCTA